VGLALRPEFYVDAPVLPSPTFCFEYKTNPDCSGETFFQSCLSQCSPIDSGEALRPCVCVLLTVFLHKGHSFAPHAKVVSFVFSFRPYVFCSCDAHDWAQDVSVSECQPAVCWGSVRGLLE
jgi:hypothetical protein